MKFLPIVLMSVFLGVLGIPVSASAQTFEDPNVSDSPSTTELVVDFRDSVSDGEVASLGSRLHLTFRPNSIEAPIDRVYVVSVPTDQESQILSTLRDESDVEGADENAVMHMDFVPNDPKYAQQWGLHRVGTEAAWNRTCGEGVTVAVIDTGVACEDHGNFHVLSDLAGTECVPGWNFVNGSSHANDDHGHGSHVAGTIAQTTNNAVGTAGIAYCARIMPVKVLSGSGSGTTANVADGIRWASDHGANVINLSLGGGGHSEVMEQAIQHARSNGTLVVCAAGNNGRYVESPAMERGAFAVSAVDNGGNIAYFSSRGPEIAVAAPGVDILQQTICDHGRNRCEQFASWSGTSMATPHVAGVAALIESLGVTSPDAVERVLRTTVEDPTRGQPELYGAGIVNADNATQHVILHHGFTRLFFLTLLALGVGFYVHKNGRLSYGFVAPAFFSSVGLFFLPFLIPRTWGVGADALSRPFLEWDVFVTGLGFHSWLPLANAFLPTVLVGLLFSRKEFRSPVAGVALGTAAYLLSTVWMNETIPPLGRFLFLGWALLNSLICIWIAAIGMDRKTGETAWLPRIS